MSVKCLLSYVRKLHQHYQEMSYIKYEVNFPPLIYVENIKISVYVKNLHHFNILLRVYILCYMKMLPIICNVSFFSSVSSFYYMTKLHQNYQEMNYIKYGVNFLPLFSAENIKISVYVKINIISAFFWVCIFYAICRNY